MSRSQDSQRAEATPHPSASRPPSPSRGEGETVLVTTPETQANTEPPSPLEGEGARRAGEGSAESGEARKEWRGPQTRRFRGFARSMRRTPTEAEARMWSLLRSRRFSGYKFRRQLPIENYIVDFVCLESRLIVELDGSQHVESASDKMRDADLTKRGFRVLRFWNGDVFAETDSVLEAIWLALNVADRGGVP